jgi:hypothetical protein
MDEATLKRIQSMSLEDAERYLSDLAAKEQRKQQNFSEMSLEELDAKRNRLSPHDQAGRKPYSDEIRKRLLGETSNRGASTLKEFIKSKLKAGSPLNFSELHARASTASFTGNLNQLIDQCQDEILTEQAISKMTPEQRAALEELAKEESEDE